MSEEMIGSFKYVVIWSNGVEVEGAASAFLFHLPPAVRVDCWRSPCYQKKDKRKVDIHRAGVSASRRGCKSRAWGLVSVGPPLDDQSLDFLDLSRCIVPIFEPLELAIRAHHYLL